MLVYSSDLNLHLNIKGSGKIPVKGYYSGIRAILWNHATQGIYEHLYSKFLLLNVTGLRLRGRKLSSLNIMELDVIPCFLLILHWYEFGQKLAKQWVPVQVESKFIISLHLELS